MIYPSIKDGRYAEQSLRLTNYPLHNHNIVYLLEETWRIGQINTQMQSKTLYVQRFVYNIIKGFL